MRGECGNTCGWIRTHGPPLKLQYCPPRPPPPIIASQLAMGVLFRLGVEDATEVSWNRGGASLGQQLGAGSILFDKALWEMWFGGRGGGGRLPLRRH